MYTLMDGMKLHQESPTTFYVPDRVEIMNLKVNDIVKLIFVEEDNRPERMWVHITEANYPNFKGTLGNDPIGLKHLKYKDLVEFEAHHIINIY